MIRVPGGDDKTHASARWSACSILMKPILGLVSPYSATANYEIEGDALAGDICREATATPRIRSQGLWSPTPTSRNLRESTGSVARRPTKHPTWGPRKLHFVLGRLLDEDEVPSPRTIARILERAGETVRRRRPKPGARPARAPLSRGWNQEAQRPATDRFSRSIRGTSTRLNTVANHGCCERGLPGGR